MPLGTFKAALFGSGTRAYDIGWLVIAGGGGAGIGHSSPGRGGGGGAGGYRSSFNSEASGGGGSSETAITTDVGIVYTITIGAGGAGSTSGASDGSNGTDSSIAGSGLVTITSVGGGGGGSAISGVAQNGGSGGGTGINGSGGVGTANQGYDGGWRNGGYGGGAGGGAGAVGGNGTGDDGGDGGAGVAAVRRSADLVAGVAAARLRPRVGLRSADEGTVAAGGTRFGRGRDAGRCDVDRCRQFEFWRPGSRQRRVSPLDRARRIRASLRDRRQTGDAADPRPGAECRLHDELPLRRRRLHVADERRGVAGQLGTMVVVAFQRQGPHRGVLWRRCHFYPGRAGAEALD